MSQQERCAPYVKCHAANGEYKFALFIIVLTFTGVFTGLFAKAYMRQSTKIV